MNEPTVQEWIMAGGLWILVTGVIYWAVTSRKFKNINLIPVIIFLLKYVNSQNSEEVTA